jgi:hypothetical protein
MLEVSRDATAAGENISSVEQLSRENDAYLQMTRVAPRQPNEAMARIAPRFEPQPNGKHQNFAGPQLDSFGVDSRFETARSSSALNFFALAVPETWDRATNHTTQSPDPAILRSAQERFQLNPPF